MYKQKRRNVRGLANAPFWSLAIADSTHRGKHAANSWLGPTSSPSIAEFPEHEDSWTLGESAIVIMRQRKAIKQKKSTMPRL